MQVHLITVKSPKVQTETSRLQGIYCTSTGMCVPVIIHNASYH